MIARHRQTVACLGLAAVVLLASSVTFGQRRVDFPPAESEPPPPAKSPPRTQSSGEDTGIIPDFGPTQRKTQERTPPPPTNLTVMYKVEYGETLEYVHPDGRTQTFEQWRSFPNDGSRLMNFVNHRLADGNNYQYATAPLSSEGFDPVDIPLLFMAGDYDFVLSEAEVQNLRRFILDGGTIVFNAARGRDEFSRSVVREMRRVFPHKSFMKLPLDHPVFNTRYRVRQVTAMVNGVQFTQPPEIYSIDLGTRAGAILIPSGMGTSWSGEAYHPAGKHIVGESAVRLGVNVVAYVLGSTEYGRFLAQEFPIYAGRTRPGDVLRFAMARYRGAWDVNPALQNSLLQAVHDNTGIPVDYTPHHVDLDDRELLNYPLVFMTGHYEFELTSAERETLRDYLERGGVLVASAAAGLSPFDEAFRREMRRTFPGEDLMALPPTHPIFEHGWVRIDGVDYTEAALQDDPTLQHPEFYGLFLDGRLAVIYTPFDFKSALNREANVYAKGVTPDDALRVAINIVAYALSH